MVKPEQPAPLWEALRPPPDAVDVLTNAKSVFVAQRWEELYDRACGTAQSNYYEVAFNLPGTGRIVEATVARVRNGVVANYPDPYMRRRDPDCMFIADDLPTDKPRYIDQFGTSFDMVRGEALEWLKRQDLVTFGFTAGHKRLGMGAMVIAPANTGFFAFGLALLQGIHSIDELPDGFSPKVVIYVAPTFRHTHFEGRQVVVHNRSADLHEMFSFNLYPGPSAKKGIYGALIRLGEAEGWITAHCSVVQVVTPYDNIVTFMHEGASGSGKSEMLEQAHREADGRLLLGRNLVTGEKRHLSLPRSCDLMPVTDDMAACHPSLQAGDGKLTVADAESAWFVRVNHITEYGTDPHLEGLTAKPPKPLLFLNIDAVPQSRALIWEHIEDSPGSLCPNPRVILPREIIPGIVNQPVTVDIRSLGLRTPPCTRANPSYGILGVFHIVPPALGWLWRLVAPRGHANPSIVDSEGMSSEGVGSYWPFATGQRTRQANLLLQQIVDSPRIRYIIVPNQHIGAWHVGFMGQWIAREYLARRGLARFRPEQLTPARCPLLGYALTSLTVEGSGLAHWFLEVDSQPEVGPDAYDQGAEQLRKFFQKTLAEYDEDAMGPLGRRILDCFRDNGTLADYESLLLPE